MSIFMRQTQQKADANRHKKKYGSIFVKMFRKKEEGILPFVSV